MIDSAKFESDQGLFFSPFLIYIIACSVKLIVIYHMTICLIFVTFVFFCGKVDFYHL